MNDRLRREYAETLKQGYLKSGFKQGFEAGYAKAKEDFERPHGECNTCKHYKGVHEVHGHAPCSFWGIGGVLSSDYCSRYEKEGENIDK